MVVVGAERSKRSPIDDVVAAGLAGPGEGDENDPKSPNPLLDGCFW